MASFFGEVVTGSYRFIDPEDPDYNDLRTTAQSWRVVGDVPVEEKLMIVCEGDVASSFASLLLGESRTVGEVRCEDQVLEVRRGQTFTAVLCSGQETGDLASTLLSLVRRDSCHVLLLTARHLSQLTGQLSQPEVFSLTTRHWGGVLPCRQLPTPNFLTGLTASLLTEGQLSGHKIALLVSYSDVLTVDSLTLEPFNIIHKIDAVTECGIKPVKNISSELSKLKLNVCDESLYM